MQHKNLEVKLKNHHCYNAQTFDIKNSWKNLYQMQSNIKIWKKMQCTEKIAYKMVYHKTLEVKGSVPENFSYKKVFPIFLA